MKTFLLVILSLLLFTSHVAASDIVTVTLKGHVTMDSDRLLMRDIVDSQETDLEFIEKYGNLKINALNETTDKIDHTKLLGSLYIAGADVEQIRFRKNTSTHLERGQKIDFSTSEKAKVIKKIAQSFQIPEQDIKIEKTRLLPSLKELSLDGLKIRKLSLADFRDLNRAKMEVSVEDFDGNKTNHTLFLQLNIETPVVTASQNLEAGQSVEEKDYLVGRKKLNSLTAPLANASLMKSKTFKTVSDIKKGDVISQNLINESLIIKEGTLVTLSYKTPFLNINTQGKLLGSSEVGKLVQVENIDSKRTVTGRLLAKDLVEVAHVQ